MVDTKCPVCKNSLETTIYDEEGGYCGVCKIWMVPESSRKGIVSTREIYADLLIQFYDEITGKLTHTWKEYQKMEMEENYD